MNDAQPDLDYSFRGIQMVWGGVVFGAVIAWIGIVVAMSIGAYGPEYSIASGIGQFAQGFAIIGGALTGAAGGGIAAGVRSNTSERRVPIVRLATGCGVALLSALLFAWTTGSLENPRTDMLLLALTLGIAAGATCACVLFRRSAASARRAVPHI